MRSYSPPPTLRRGFWKPPTPGEYPGLARFDETPFAAGALRPPVRHHSPLRRSELRLGRRREVSSSGSSGCATGLWESLYREDVDPALLSPLERSRADFQAQVAKTLKRHEETVDLLEYIRPDYLEKSGILRRLEFVLNLLDLLNRARRRKHRQSLHPEEQDRPGADRRADHPDRTTEQGRAAVAER